MATSPYASAADSYAQQYGIPPSIFRAVIQNESAWDPTADAHKNFPNSHAYGLTQLQPGTAAAMGVTDINDPMQQLMGGAKYLSQMYAQFGNWNDALAAYAQGPGGVASDAGQAYGKKILSNAAYDPAVAAVAAQYEGPKDAAQAAQQNAIFGDAADGSDGPIVAFIKKYAANVGLVALGIGVLLVGIVMTDAGQKAAKTVVKTAA